MFTQTNVGGTGVVEPGRVGQEVNLTPLLTPFSETFWSPGLGSLVDRFGIPGMINTNPPADAKQSGDQSCEPGRRSKKLDAPSPEPHLPSPEPG